MASNTARSANYRETHFEFPTLTPIRGEPTADTLIVLCKQLKANAKTVPSNLGGGTLGHLGLVIPPVRYALLSNVPFDRQNHPGPLVIPPGTAQHTAATMRDLHQEQLRVFTEVNAVDQALKQQISRAIEPDYLNAIRDRTSNSITVPVFEVLEFLGTTYGKVTEEQLQEKEDRVNRMAYSLHQPIDLIFNSLDDLADYAELSDTPYTERQIVSKAYVILNRTQRFQQPLLDWKRRPRVQQTWTNFKQFFRTAHTELRSVNNFTLEQAQRNEERANLVAEVVQGIQNALPDTVFAPPNEAPPPPPPDDPPMEHAFMANQQQQLTPFQQFQQMQMMFNQMMAAHLNQPPGNGRPGNRSRRTRVTNRYCWTHGACAHTGAECRAPATGHQAAATFQDRMGGIPPFKSPQPLNLRQPGVTYASIVAKADSGASKHYFRPQDATILHAYRPIQHSKPVNLPDGSTITSTHQGLLPLSNTLSPSARTASVLPSLHSASLVSLGQLCDDDCQIKLDKHALTATKNGKVVLRGTRNPRDGLWDVSLPVIHSLTTNQSSSTQPPVQIPTEYANVIIRKNQTNKELATYLHAACGSPAVSTFLTAIKKGFLLSWPGIELITESDLTPSLATAKGHLDQERKNLQTTKSTPPSLSHLDPLPLPDVPPTTTSPPLANKTTDAPLADTNTNNPTTAPEKTQECFSVIHPFDKKAYSDQTGRYPHISSRGNQYIMVVYDYDSSGILVHPLKNRTAGEITKAWQHLHARLERHGNAPRLYILDNEISYEFKSALQKKQVSFQLVPPHIHRRNAAERAIRTFKNHFLAVLATADPQFPVSEWDRLLPQSELTLNLLRPSRVNPRLSAYAYLFGNFDFNKTPLAPAGTRVLVHEKPKQRKSWAYHGVEGWYIGPSLNHYRCVRCYIPSTGAVRDADTVQFFPTTVKFPRITTEDMLVQSATDILTVLQTPPPSLIPKITYGDDIRNAIDQIARLLNRAVQRTKPTAQKLPLSPPPPVPRPSAPRVQPASLPRVAASPSPRRISPRRVSPRCLPVAAAAAHISQPIKPSAITFAIPDPHKYAAQACNHLVAQQFFSTPTISHIYNDTTGKKETIDSLLAGNDSATWRTALSNELGRLANGVGNRVTPTNTIEFIHRHEVPRHKKVTYANMVCDFRPLKSEPNRVRLTVGGDRLPYAQDAGSPAATLLEAKLILNSTISDADAGARFFATDLKDFFLATPMDEPEYMRLHSKYFFDDIKLEYDITSKIANDGFVYIKINKGMYGLKQAAVLAYRQLVSNLARNGYFPCPSTTGIWRHRTRRTRFCLCVDDFGVKVFSDQDKEHFLQALRENYKISVDHTGKNYLGLQIDWHYDKGYVDISMPGYIKKLRDRLAHPDPSRPQYAPHRWTQPAYGLKTQYAPEPDSSSPLDTNGTKFVQSTTGSLLYYSRAVDPTMLVALNEIATSQASPTETTRAKVMWLLDYVATYPNAKIRFTKSDMILYVDSDAAYLVLPNARSRYAGHFYLSNKPQNPSCPRPPRNGPIHTECKAIRSVVASAAEAETTGVFGNSQIAIPIRRALEALGHPQPPTPIKTDNSTAYSFVNANIRQKRSKTWDMRFNWLRDRATKKELHIYWDKGSNNDADYYTKHHPPSHHRNERHKYILQNFNMTRSVLPNSNHPLHKTSFCRGAIHTMAPKQTKSCQRAQNRSFKQCSLFMTPHLLSNHL